MKRIFCFGLALLFLAGCFADTQSSGTENQIVSSSLHSSSISVPFEPEIAVTKTEIPLPQEEPIKWKEAAISGDWIALSGQFSNADAEGLYGTASNYYLYRYSLTDNSTELLPFDIPIANGWTDGTADYWAAVNDWSIWRQPYGGEAERIAQGVKRGMGAPYLYLSGDTLLWEEYESTQTEPPYLELYSLTDADRKVIDLPRRIASVNISDKTATTVCETNGKTMLTSYDLTDWEKTEEAETSLVPKASKSMESSAALLGGNVLVKGKDGSLRLQNASGDIIEICSADVKSFVFWNASVLYTTRDALMLYDLDSAQTAELYTLQEDERFFSVLMPNGEMPGIFIEQRSDKVSGILWLELKE